MTSGGHPCRRQRTTLPSRRRQSDEKGKKWRSFHGQSQGAMTLGGDNRRWAAEPGITGVVHFLNPDPYRSVFGADVDKALAHVEEVIWYEGPEYIAAILVEPIPGTSGVLVPPDRYLRGLRGPCDKYGI